MGTYVRSPLNSLPILKFCYFYIFKEFYTVMDLSKQISGKYQHYPRITEFKLIFLNLWKTKECIIVNEHMQALLSSFENW